MTFEWGEAKRQSNLAKQGIDFLRAEALFDGRPVITALSKHTEEVRFVTTGEIDGQFYTVIWTRRGDAIRLISARRASGAEQRAYRSLHGGRN
jgi:uncharacterized DUF497 family protein